MKDKLITVKYTAELLGCTVATVQKLCRQGKLPAQRIGHTWYIHYGKFMQGFEIKPTPATGTTKEGLTPWNAPLTERDIAILEGRTPV